MALVKHMGKEFEVDGEGFLLDAAAWCPEWADHVREEEDLDELCDDHWEIIETLRAYAQEHGAPPRVKELPAVCGFKLKYIYELFPSGPGKGACKMAGLAKPEGCV